MCTGIRLMAYDGAPVYGRTLEFGRALDSKIIIIPRKYPFCGTTPLGKEGKLWQSRYAVVGINALNIVGIIDGVNERGLAGGLFYFPGYASYQEVTPADYKETIASWELLTFILTTCATVAQVRATLDTLKVCNAVLPEWGSQVPIHAIIHDTTGASLVIEYVQGALQLHDNPLGVITNAPDFNWHLTNLRNYTHLSPYNDEKNILGPLTLAPFGHSSGLLGLPGNFTPPERFVRAAFLSQLALMPKTANQARTLLFHILDFFNIPIGVLRESKEGKTVYDYTQWTSGVDLNAKKYYWHTYANRDLRMVDLMAFDLMSSEPVYVPMDHSEDINDSADVYV